MAFMEWITSLEIGDEMIDRQHRKLVDLINDVHAVSEDASRSEDILHCITAMFLYAKEHFFDEEGLMERLDYPDRERHAAMHRAFVAKARQLADDCLEGKMCIDDMLEFLVRWLRHHIANEDARIIRESPGAPKA
jgi:hemerythrin-like metal-binding protein